MADSDDENMFDGHVDEEEEDDDLIRHTEPEAETEDPEAVLAECVACFESKDFIMESNVFQQLQQYFTAGGSPDTAVDLLSSNYSALAQMANFLAELQIMAGIDIKEVQDVVENHLKSMIIKYFDPKRADSIFTDEGEPPAWLAELINYPTWRHLVYELAEEFPDCLMLNFTIKLISDAGYQGEITSVSTACHQIEVFSRVLKTTLSEILLGGEAKMKSMLPEFGKMICHGEHTYLYSQILMQALCDDVKGSATIRRLCQEVEQIAKEKGYDVTPISLGLSGAALYKQACTALSSMLCRNALNPADITTLYKVYTSSDPPPVSLLRSPSLLGLFMESLFKPGAKVNPEHKGKYIYLLAYASTVAEVWKRNIRKSINKDELEPTKEALEKACELCAYKASSELLPHLPLFFDCLRYPVVAKCALYWIEIVLSSESYFKFNTDPTPLHLALVDEISTNHSLLHNRIFDILISIFERNFKELEDLVQLELKKTVVDRMIHLTTCDYVVPVIKYIVSKWKSKDTDFSLIRHFIAEFFDVIDLPISKQIIENLKPLLKDEDLIKTIQRHADLKVFTEFMDEGK